MKIKSKTNPDMDIDSRRDIRQEEAELQNFINLMDMFSLSQFMDSIFYDSGCQMAFYKFKWIPPCIELKIKQQVDDVAAIALRQYEDSRGFTGHGAPMEDD
jgi:hypothetical protein